MRKNSLMMFDFNKYDGFFIDYSNIVYYIEVIIFNIDVTSFCEMKNFHC